MPSPSKLPAPLAGAVLLSFLVHSPLRGQAGRVTHPSRPFSGLLLLPPGQEGQGSVNVTLLASFHSTRLTTPPTLSVGPASPKHKQPAPFHGVMADSGNRDGAHSMEEDCAFWKLRN